MNPGTILKALSSAKNKLWRTVPKMSGKWHGRLKAKPEVARKIKQIKNVRGLLVKQNPKGVKYKQKSNNIFNYDAKYGGNMNIYNHKGMKVPGMIQDGGALPRMGMGGTIKALKALSQKSALASSYSSSTGKLFGKDYRKFVSKQREKSSKLNKKLRGQQVDYFSKHGRWPKGVGKTPTSRSADYIKKGETQMYKKLGANFDDTALGSMRSTTGYAKRLQTALKNEKRVAKHNRKVRTKRKKGKKLERIPNPYV